MIFEKLCSKCGLVKPSDCFYKNKRSKDGYQKYCRICHKEMVKSYLSRCPEQRTETKKNSRHKCWFKNAEENRSKSRKFRRDGKRINIERRANEKRKTHFKDMKQEAVNYLGGKCSKCGYVKSLAAIEFHHVDPSIKEFGIGAKLASMCSNSKTTYKDIIGEIDKCILLCSNCHNELHSYS